MRNHEPLVVKDLIYAQDPVSCCRQDDPLSHQLCPLEVSNSLLEHPLLDHFEDLPLVQLE